MDYEICATAYCTLEFYNVFSPIFACIFEFSYLTAFLHIFVSFIHFSNLII